MISSKFSLERINGILMMEHLNNRINKICLHFIEFYNGAFISPTTARQSLYDDVNGTTEQ